MKKTGRRIRTALFLGGVVALLFGRRAEIFAMDGESALRMSAVQDESFWPVPDPGGMDERLSEEIDAIDQFLRRNISRTGENLSFLEFMKVIASGDGKRIGRMILDMVRDGLFDEIQSGWNAAVQVLAIGICGSVFAGFSGIFSEGGISETGFFMTYLMAFTVLAASFFQGVRVAAELLEQLTGFMRMLLPVYLSTVVWAGQTMTAAAWYEAGLFLIGAVEGLYVRLLLPLTPVYVLLVMAGNMEKEELLSKLTGFLSGAIRWGTRSLFGVAVGFQLVQGMVLPYADAVRSAGLQKLLAAIPGIGQGVETVAKLTLGSATLIKNCAGATAIVLLAVLSLIPLMKLTVPLILYRLAAAFLEPVADKRLVACVNGVADGQRLLLGLAGSGTLLFITAIALICMSGYTG